MTQSQRLFFVRLFNIENLVLGARSEFNGFARTGASSFGVLEYWSTGVLECWEERKSRFKLNWSFHYSITPPLQHSSRLTHGGKTIEPRQGAVQSRVFWVRILYFYRHS